MEDPQQSYAFYSNENSDREDSDEDHSPILTDLEELICCKICLNKYSLDNPVLKPILLECHHPLCLSCASSLPKYQEKIKCPLCRCRTKITTKGFQENFYVVKILEAMKQRKVRERCNYKLLHWCQKCNTIAEETCATHEIELLSHTLLKIVSNYSSEIEEVHKNVENITEAFAKSQEYSKATAHLKSSLELLVTFVEEFIVEMKAFEVVKEYNLHRLGEMNRKLKSMSTDYNNHFPRLSENCSQDTSSEDLPEDKDSIADTCRKNELSNLSGCISNLPQYMKLKQITYFEKKSSELKNIKKDLCANKREFNHLQESMSKINTNGQIKRLESLVSNLQKAFEARQKEIKDSKEETVTLPDDASRSNRHKLAWD